MPTRRSRLRPDAPGRVARRPHVLELLALAQGVHRVPEAPVEVGLQVPLGGQRLERLALPHGRVAVDVAPDVGLEDEEAAVDPRAVPARLLEEPGDAVAVDLQRAEATARLHGGDGGERAAGAVVPDERGDVDVGDAVAVGEAERLVAYVGQDALQAPAGHRLLARLDERDPPRLRRRVVDLHLARAEVEGHVRGVQRVVREPLLDDVALVAEAHDEVVDPGGGVDLHDVPEDRLAADLDHRLRPQRRLLAEPRAEAAGEDHRLHATASPCARNASAWPTVTARMFAPLRSARYQSTMLVSARSRSHTGAQPSRSRAFVESSAK